MSPIQQRAVMRQGQQNKRPRGRNRKGPNPLARSYESNGPDVKIRGTALHIAEKYVMLARDAQTAGDRVAEQSYLQHAEHYYRIVAAAQAQMPQPQTVFRADDDDDGDDDGGDFPTFDRPREPQVPDRQREFGQDRQRDYQSERPREFSGDRPRENYGDRQRDYQPRERRDYVEPGSQSGVGSGFAETAPHANGNVAAPIPTNGNGQDQPPQFSDDRRDDQSGSAEFRGRRRRPNRGRRRPEGAGEGLPYNALSQMAGDEAPAPTRDQGPSED